MKTKLVLSAVILLSLAGSQVQSASPGTAFNYQGHLNVGGTAANGTYDFRFALYNALEDGAQVGTTITNAAVTVSGGCFSASLDFGSVFDGNGRWLALGVRTNGSAADFQTLAPRQALLPSPYSMYSSTAAAADVATNLAGTLPPTQLAGNYPSTVTLTNPANSLGGDGSRLTALNAGSLSSGTVSDSRLSGNVALRSGGNAFTGNQSVMSGTLGVGITTPAQNLHVVGNAQFDKNDGRIVLRTPTRNDPGRYGITFSNNILGLFLGDDTQPQVFAFYSAFAKSRTNDASISVFGKATNNWDRSITLTHNGTNGIVSTDSGHLLLAPNLNVGIGIDDPQSELEVAGTVTASKLRGNGAMPWEVVSGATQAASPNTAYMANNAAQVTITLPASPALADVVRVSGAGAGGWRIAPNSGQTIFSPTFGIGSWIARGGNRWSFIAACSMASNVVAGFEGAGSSLHVSRDGGETWTTRGGVADWRSAAVSSTGAKMLASVYGGQLYTSTDYGSNWTARASARNWMRVASSADGARLVAAVNGGYLYTSTDSGANWFERTEGGSRAWTGLASSSDGLRLLAAANSGHVYTSSNAGTNWTQAPPTLPSLSWTAAASSADGSKLVICATGASGDVYISSNSGASWNPRNFSGSWWSVAVSANGSRVLGAIYSDRIYDLSSSNTAISDPGHWSSVALSADGKRIIAGLYDGEIYTYAGTPAYMTGLKGAVLELQHIGGGVFMPLSHLGPVSYAY